MSPATKTRMLAATGLLLMDFGIFTAVSVFLPRARGFFSYHGSLSQFVNSRARWDIAWGVFFAALLFSAGVFLLMEALGAFRRPSKTTDPARTGDATPRV